MIHFVLSGQTGKRSVSSKKLFIYCRATRNIYVEMRKHLKHSLTNPNKNKVKHSLLFSFLLFLFRCDKEISPFSHQVRLDFHRIRLFFFFVLSFFSFCYLFELSRWRLRIRDMSHFQHFSFHFTAHRHLVYFICNNNKRLQCN